MLNIRNSVCVLTILFIFCKAQAQEDTPDDIQLMLTNDQRSIVSALSGASKVDGGKTLKRRWTDTEKTLARNYLRARLAEIHLEAREHAYKVNLRHVKPSRNPLKGTNLFTEIPATTKSTDYVIIGAHYDTVSESPGAMDNATGCALAFGVAKLITRMAHRNKNLIIVFFDQEEIGHAGSYAFANYIREKALSVHSVHTFDMVGWDKDGDRNIELEVPTQQLEALYKKQAQLAGIVAYTTETTETDHREFRNAGFNAIGIGGEYKHGDTSPHHHLPTDTVDTVNFEYLKFVTFLVYRAIEELMVL